MECISLIYKKYTIFIIKGDSMFKRLFLLTMLGTLLSGCFVAPMAFIGPATSGFTTASIIQSGVTTGANYLVKKSTGKTITEHAFETLNKDILQQTYFPKEKTDLKEVLPKSKSPNQ